MWARSSGSISTLSSVISIFVEINPRYYFSNAGLVHVRSGVNFHIGDPSENPVTRLKTVSRGSSPIARTQPLKELCPMFMPNVRKIAL